MSTLYLDRSGGELTCRDSQLVITHPGGRRTVPLALVERVVIAARTTFDSHLLGKLAEAGVAVTLLDIHRSRRRAQVLGHGHNDAALRLAQYRAAGDPDRRLSWAKRLVAAKLRRQRCWLASLRDERPDARRHLDRATDRLRRLETAVPDADTLAALRGLEGSAGRVFFAAYRHLFPAGLGFDGRRRRPPPDPVNAALSLAYTLLHHRAVQMAWAAGLDPLIGFYHETAWGRESLACDLIEPWRPCVEAWVYDWFRTRWLDATHFHRKGDTCLLGKAGRQRFFAAFEQRVKPVQRALRRQAARLAAQLRETAS